MKGGIKKCQDKFWFVIFDITNTHALDDAPYPSGFLIKWRNQKFQQQAYLVLCSTTAVCFGMKYMFK